MKTNHRPDPVAQFTFAYRDARLSTSRQFVSDCGLRLCPYEVRQVLELPEQGVRGLYVALWTNLRDAQDQLGRTIELQVDVNSLETRMWVAPRVGGSHILYNVTVEVYEKCRYLFEYRTFYATVYPLMETEYA